jgi:hypothetical protein
MAVKSVLRSGLALLPGSIFWYSFLLEVESTPKTIAWLEGLGNLKKIIDLVGIRTSYLPVCSIVPKPTTLTRALTYIYISLAIYHIENYCK